MKKIALFLILLISATSLFAKSKAKDTEKTKSSGYYIYEKKVKNVFKGPYETLDEVLLAWRDELQLPGNKQYYIGEDGVLITNNPIKYYRQRYKEIDKRISRENAIVIDAEGFDDDYIIPERSMYESDAIDEITETAIAQAPEVEEIDIEEDTFTAVAIADFEETEELEAVDLTPPSYDFLLDDDGVEEVIAFADSDTSLPNVLFTDELETQKPSEVAKVDSYQKVYLSDFMETEELALPSNDEYTLDNDLIADLNEIDAFGRTSLMKAIKAGNDWKIKALLNAGADVNAKDKDGWTALMYAVRYQSNLSILELLLEKEPEIRVTNKYGHSPLIIASCFNDNPDIIKRMLSFYMPSEKEVQKAFILLLSSQSISEYTLTTKMKVFLDLGLPINSYYNGKTPLMYACKYCSSTKALKLLMDSNARIQVRSSDGKTAFQYASENKNLKHDDIYWSLNRR